MRSLPPSGSRAFIVGRYSSDMQNPKSADDQVREGEAFAARQGWQVVGSSKDEAKSGRTLVGRTAFYDAMAAAEAGDCDVILVEDISRLSRDAADILMAARTLKEHNVCICTIGGGVLDGFELGIRAQMAQEQSEEMGRRIRRGHRSGAIRGRAMGSLAFGYKFRDSPDEQGVNREIDETKRSVVNRIFKDVAAGLSGMQIARALNDEGVPAADGGLWRPKAITGDPHLLNGIVRNPIYIGRLIYGKSKSRFLSSKGVREISPGLLSEQIVTEAPQLRIVDDKLWEDVQAVMDAHSRRLLDEKGRAVPNRVRRPRHPLSGLIKCGRCGSTYAVAARGGLGCDGRRLGLCENSRRVARLDVQAAVFDALKHRLLLPHLIQDYVDEYRREFRAASTQSAEREVTVETQLREVDRHTENLLNLARISASDPDTAALLQADLAKLVAKKKRLTRELAARPADPALLSMESDAIIGRLSTMLDDLGGALDGAERDAARAREILRSFITRVVVTPLDTSDPADGRGSGPLRVTVEGALPGLMGLTSIDRVVQRRESPFATLDHAKWAFSVYVDLPSSRVSARTFSDIALVSRLLDDARVPLRKRDMIVAMEREASPLSEGKPPPDAFQRVSAALKHLGAAGLIRPIVVDANYTGWVWTDTTLDDDEWRARARNPAEAARKYWRVIPPEAFVTVLAEGGFAGSGGAAV